MSKQEAKVPKAITVYCYVTNISLSVSDVINNQY